MKFNINQQDLQKSLNYCQGVIEKRSTLPILSNVLLDVSNGKLTITATDLDLIFIHKISNIEILEEGKTTTSASIMYDIVRKISSGKKINFSNPSENKLQLESEKSLFNLNCINCDYFFEGWFQNTNDFKKQKKLKLITCPNCESLNIKKALVAPNISKKSNSQQLRNKKTLASNIKKIKKIVEDNFEYVGDNFTEEAKDCKVSGDMSVMT